MKSKKKIVLAYSGGLDTSIILKWLQENYDAEVICYTADVGQEIDRKKIITNAKKFGVKNIIIQDFIYEKQPEIIDNFLVAAKKSLKDVEVSYLNFEKIINLTTTELNSSVKSIFLIICNDDLVRRITTSKFKDKYIKETKNNRYMFNTLLVSDKITNEIKKAIWEDFLQIKDYE